LGLSEIPVPTLIVSHRKDACEITPAADAPKLSKRLTKASKVELALLDGGDPPLSDPCGAKAQHGYFGIEVEAVNTIAKFVRGNSEGMDADRSLISTRMSASAICGHAAACALARCVPGAVIPTTSI